MKKHLYLLASVLIALFITSCEGFGPEQTDTILPETFGIDIPDAISFDQPQFKSAAVEPLNGNLIYRHLATFIRAGEVGSDITRDIIHGIRKYGINEPMSLSYTSDDDGRVKNLLVTESPYFEGQTWEFMLTITDAESESNDDGGKALQIVWNRFPVKGIAVLKPFNMNRRDDARLLDVVYRIDYSAAADRGYEAYMMVAVSGLPLEDPLDNPYSMSTLKMFAGRNGDVIDVYGNSDHPNAKFFNSESGFNWAFVASGDDTEDIGVAEIGLPPSYLDEPSRNILLGTYSVKNVFTEQIYEVWPNIDPQSVETYLLNTAAPGFFNTNGFVQGGEAPGEEYNALVERLTSLSPYNPKEIAELTISFMN